MDCSMFTMGGRRTDGTIRICTVLTEQVDKQDLYLALTWDSARCNQQQRSIPRGDVRTRVEDHAGNVDDIGWKRSVTNRIFGHELEQSRRTKVISTFKENVLMNQFWMQLQQRSQPSGVTGIKKVHGAAKYRVFNTFMVTKI